MRRLQSFLYSRRNIVGSLLALGGLALHFAGIVAGPIWLPITIGLYAIGYLLVPAEPNLSIQFDAAEDASQVRAGLDHLLGSIRGRVADDLYTKVVSIQGSILGTLEAEGGTNEADPNVYLIRQTALSYLPDAFTTYLQMPRQIAERRAIANGRTPHDVLLDQLDLMDKRLVDVADDIARHDSDKLLANGRFLAEKFGSSSFSLDGLAGADATAAAIPTASAAATTEPAEAEVAIPVAEPVAEPEQVPEKEQVAERERVR